VILLLLPAMQADSAITIAALARPARGGIRATWTREKIWIQKRYMIQGAPRAAQGCNQYCQPVQLSFGMWGLWCQHSVGQNTQRAGRLTDSNSNSVRDDLQTENAYCKRFFL